MARGGKRVQEKKAALIPREERAAFFAEARQGAQHVCDGCNKQHAAKGVQPISKLSDGRYCWTCRKLLAQLIAPLQTRTDLDGYYTRRYGIVFSTYVEILVKQGGKCFICQSSPDDKHLFVDHDHDTNAVRGLLCLRCNTGLGMFRDNIASLARATIYLTENPAQSIIKQTTTPITSSERARHEKRRQAREEYFQRIQDPDDCFGT